MTPYRKGPRPRWEGGRVPAPWTTVGILTQDPERYVNPHTGDYVLVDSAVNGGGCCVRDREGRVLVDRREDVAWVIGEDHPAIVACREATHQEMAAMRRGGRELAEILRDEVRFLR